MDIGVPELVIILLVVVLIFGPGRLVGLGRELGTGIHQFRQGLSGQSKQEEDKEDKSLEKLLQQFAEEDALARRQLRSHTRNNTLRNQEIGAARSLVAVARAHDGDRPGHRRSPSPYVGRG